MTSFLNLMALSGLSPNEPEDLNSEQFVTTIHLAAQECHLPSSDAADPVVWLDGCNQLMTMMFDLEERRQELQDAALAASEAGDSLAFLRALGELQSVLAAQEALMDYQTLCNAIRAKLSPTAS